MIRALIILFWLLSAMQGDLLAVDDSRKFAEIGAEECEFEMLVLDGLVNDLVDEPNSVVYIIVYGGRSDTKRNEVQVRGARMKRYLIEDRGVSPECIIVTFGGYRKVFTAEIWITPRGGRIPLATPTVNRKDVRFRKGKMESWREPGCFPGKYTIPSMNPSTNNVSNRRD